MDYANYQVDLYLNGVQTGFKLLQGLNKTKTSPISFSFQLALFKVTVQNNYIIILVRTTSL